MSTSRPAVGALVLLDANILYPIRLCDFFLAAGTVGLIAKPVVSEEILAEAQRNVTADRSDLGEDRIKRRFDAVRTATSGGDDSIPKRYFDTTVVNEKARHVSPPHDSTPSTSSSPTTPAFVAKSTAGSANDRSRTWLPLSPPTTL